MFYYHFNKKEVLGKAKERYSKEKTPEHYLQNEETIKQKQKNRHKNLPEKENEAKRGYGRNRCSNIVEDKQTS